MSSSGSPTRLQSLVSTFIVALFVSSSFGLKVTPGSACASYCLDDAEGDSHNADDSTTTASDIVCNNADYWSTPAGTKYRTCINCLQNSTAVNGTESDTAWYLYNIRYAVDVCLFSYPSVDSKNTSLSSPCDLPSNCEPLRVALTSGLSAQNETDLGYCSADNGAFEDSSMDNCMQCLQSEPQQTYLANFLTALSTGCKQQPSAGELLGLNGTLFATTSVGIIAPKGNQTTPTEASPVTTMNTGIIVGLAVGIGLFLIGSLAIFFYWRRKKSHAATREQFDDYPHKRSPSQANSISSSMSGGLAPYYTTDYKTQYQPYQNSVELYDRVKSQHIVLPDRGTGDALDSSMLWGKDSPNYPVKQLGPASIQSLPTRQIIHNTAANANLPNGNGLSLDGVPIHPAFVPRVFSRPSRGLAPLPQAEVRIKTYKPDGYVEALAARNNSNNNNNSNNSNASTMGAASASWPILPPPPPPPPAPVPIPSLVLPSLTRVRSPRTYVPPPILVDVPAAKAGQKYKPAAESGLP